MSLAGGEKGLGCGTGGAADCCYKQHECNCIFFVDGANKSSPLGYPVYLSVTYDQSVFTSYYSSPAHCCGFLISYAWPAARPRSHSGTVHAYV